MLAAFSLGGLDEDSIPQKKNRRKDDAQQKYANLRNLRHKTGFVNRLRTGMLLIFKTSGNKNVA